MAAHPAVLRTREELGACSTGRQRWGMMPGGFSGPQIGRGAQLGRATAPIRLAKAAPVDASTGEKRQFD
jgi:hypothetical protein